MNKPLLFIIIICALSNGALAAESVLSPADFGLTLTERGQIDMTALPNNIAVGHFNGDCYPDIARFEGNRLEVFISKGWGFPIEPSMMKYFGQPIKSIRLEGPMWTDNWDIVLTMLDDTEETIPNHRGCLQMGDEVNLFKKYASPPPRVKEADFELVWESEPRPYGMDRCAVGDLDNDGINELVTWYKEYHYADTAWMLIYKSIGDDEYDLFLQEPFFSEPGQNPALTQIMITDMDQNGQKELVYTLQFTYFWEFSEPGVYYKRRSSFAFARAVKDGKVCDTDQDGVMELAFVTSNIGMQPPTQYVVQEYSYKTSQYFGFTGITGFYQDWIDCRLDVGDFDNDGVVNIVSGNAAPVSGLYPVDIQYFCYDSTVIWNFTQHWLNTGIASSCVTPIIADFDNDDENELFAGGLFANGGSAFLYEPTGFGSGYVTWSDTTSAPNGPNESNNGIVDYSPSVISIHIIPGFPDDSILLLWYYTNNGFINSWQSAVMDCVAYHNPCIFDIDNDHKKNILVAGSWSRIAHDWDQVSAGIGHSDPGNVIYDFQLYPNYPNPFNEKTIIKYFVKQKSDIYLKIYDVNGRLVYNRNEKDAARGHYDFEWDASRLSSGVYLISLFSDNNRQTVKAVLLK